MPIMEKGIWNTTKKQECANSVTGSQKDYTGTEYPTIHGGFVLTAVVCGKITVTEKETSL